MLDLESAQLFLRVAECGSLSRAARESYLAKSMVKHRMDELEEFVGAELLARGSHGVALTKAGEVFKHRAREMLALVETTRAECQAAAHSASGRTIRIAYYSDFVFPMVQYVCDYYLSRHPDDKISPVFIKFQDAHKSAREGLVDVAICTRPPESELAKLEGRELYKTRMVGLVAIGSPLASRPSLSRSDLASHNVVVHPMWCPKEEIRAWEQKGVPAFDVTVDDGSAQSMQKTITNGGIYLYPETDAYLFPYRALALDDPLYSASTLVFKKNPSPITMDFVRDTHAYIMPYVDQEHRLTIDWHDRPVGA